MPSRLCKSSCVYATNGYPPSRSNIGKAMRNQSWITEKTAFKITSMIINANKRKIPPKTILSLS